MPYLVALTRFCALTSLDDEAPAIAPALGLAPYDMRLKLATPPPVVLAPAAELARAQALVALLRERGHGVVACDTARLPAPEHAFFVRGFELRPDALVVTDRPGRALCLPYPEIAGLFRAAEITNEVETAEVVQKKLALGRAALTGGLMRRKAVKSVETRASSDRQEVLYLFRRSAPEPIVLEERGLDYAGLGERRSATYRENFTALTKWLQRGAPHAVYDDRLLATKRRTDLASVQTGVGKRVVVDSNSAANQLAAFLLMYAHVQAQV